MIRQHNPLPLCMWQIKTRILKNSVTLPQIYSFALRYFEVWPILFASYPFRDTWFHSSLWTNMQFFFFQWRHLDTLWWKIPSICHYLMVWYGQSVDCFSLISVCLCLPLFSDCLCIFFLSSYPASLLPKSLWSRTIPPPSSEFPQNTLLHFSHLFAGVRIAIGTFVN